MIQKRKRVDLALRIWAIFILSGFSIFSAITLYNISGIFYKTTLARSWISTTASVDRFDDLGSLSSRSSSAKFKIEYNYLYKGKIYRGDTFDYNQAVMGWNAEDSILFKEKYRAGQRIGIYVNPDSPNESVVQREMRSKLVWPLIFGMVFIFSPIFAYKYL